ncbi:unnamed protein product [Gongylonema pulchrum]|uniref:Ras-GEF domain-containing protein n=1 Tax=Gongylonema pulchrum TaxID=637853 RepID=A0A183EBR6_9BILA|nr:unnamed protein product [Gongylonema pulchrum]
MRMRFFKLFNARIAKKIYERLYHILALEDWAQFQHHFFIKHCINLLLWSVIEENKEKKSNEVIQTALLNCATFWRTYETVFDLETLRRNHPGANDNDDQVLWDQDMDETKRSISSEISGDQLSQPLKASRRFIVRSCRPFIVESIEMVKKKKGRDKRRRNIWTLLIRHLPLLKRKCMKRTVPRGKK